MSRALSVAARTVHLTAFAILLGGDVGDIGQERLLAVWLVTVTSGLALMAIETVLSPTWLLEVRGAVVLGKLGLLLIVPATEDFRMPLLLLVLVVASVTLIFALPRKTTGAAWGAQRGGLFLPVVPGSDVVLHLAIARLILENGWEDREFIAKWVSNEWEIDTGMGRGPRNTPVEWFTTWGRYGVGFTERRLPLSGGTLK